MSKRAICRCAPDCRERIECPKVGVLGHSGCGWCDVHDQARHKCLCPVDSEQTRQPASSEREGQR